MKQVAGLTLLWVVVVAALVFIFTGSGNDRDSENAVKKVEKGNLIMIGGGARPSEIMQLVVDLSKDGHLIVVPMASSIPDTVGWEQRDELLAHGAREVEIMMLEPQDIGRSEITRRLRNAGGIWFSGGDQRRLMEFFEAEEMREAVKAAWKSGAVIAGTSAGTAVQSRVMITGDEAYPGRQPFGVIRHQNVIRSAGIGLVENMIVDQHFIVRGRLNRLINVLIDDSSRYAAGIDESTALWFKSDDSVEVIGESQVILLDAGNMNAKIYEQRMLGASGINMHVLPPGSSFSWKNNRVGNITLADPVYDTSRLEYEYDEIEVPRPTRN